MANVAAFDLEPREVLTRVDFAIGQPFVQFRNYHVIVGFNVFWIRVSPVRYLLQGQLHDFLLCHRYLFFVRQS
jgi:hypothetical protein